MTHLQNNSKDLLSDPKFIDWVAHSNSHLDQYWNSWMAEHPERRAEVCKAKAFLQALNFQQPSAPSIDKADLLQKINDQKSTK